MRTNTTENNLQAQVSGAQRRKLSEIAAEIRQAWPKPYYGAVPYIAAMENLHDIGDFYGCDDARSIVLYFLSNATTWRGDVARRIKAELKGLVGAK